MKCLYKNRLGANGEMIARNFLCEKNYKFLKNNFRYQRAEIDLIFEDEDNKLLIFTEVKTRSNKKFGEPEESVTMTKQNQIRKAVHGFISANEKYQDYDLRIDVITILFCNSKAEINHIENAF